MAQVAAGAYHSLLVRADGTVWAWGDNTFGQLGDGTLTNRSSPVQVPGLSGVTALSAGYDHTVALRQDGPVDVADPGTGGLLPDTGNVVPRWLAVTAVGVEGADVVDLAPGEVVKRALTIAGNLCMALSRSECMALFQCQLGGQ